MAVTEPILLPQRAPAPQADEVLFVGNATVLLRLAGFTILTDPNFLHAGDTARLGGGLRSRRLKPPALSIGDLPPLDLVLLSHHHGDHFDEVAAAQLDHGLPIVTTSHAARKLVRQGFDNPLPLRTWESRTFVRDGRQLRITALPAQHGPAPVARVLPETMGSLVEVSGEGTAGSGLYVTGDTVIHDALAEIPRRHPRIDCALVHLGETRVLGVLLTMDADQGVELLRITRPRHALPIHVDDYTVQRMRLADLTAALDRAEGLATEVHNLPRGRAVALPGSSASS